MRSNNQINIPRLEKVKYLLVKAIKPIEMTHIHTKQR